MNPGWGANWRFASRWFGAASVLASFWAGPALAAPDPAAVAAKLVNVVAFDGDQNLGTVTGLVVTGNGRVVTVERLLRRADRIAVIVPGGSAQLVARVEATERALDLALLAVPGLEATPVTLARDAASAGLPVHVPVLDPTAPPARRPTLSSGTVGRVSTPRSGAGGALLEHNALSADLASLGAPVLNDCGEAVALNRTDPTKSGLFDNPLAIGASFVYALPAADLAAFLVRNGIVPSQATDPCVPASRQAAEAAKAEAERAAQAQSAADKAKAEAEAASRKANDAQRRAKQLEEAAETARRKVDELKGTAEAEAAARATAEDALRKAEAEAADARVQADKALEGAEAARAALEEELARVRADADARERLGLYIIIGGGVALLLLIVLAILLTRRQKRRALMAEAEAKAAAAEAEAVRRSYQEVVTASAPDVVLEGATPEGTVIAIKLPGEALARSREGIVIGRSLSDAGIILDHPSVSRGHLRIRAGGGGLTLEDLGATNGTAVNGQRLQPRMPVALNNGDRVTIGAVETCARVIQ